MQHGRVANIPTVASLLAAFFAISATGGVLGAGLAMPAAATFGTASKATIGMYDSLPAELKSVVPNQQTQLLAADGRTTIATLYSENRVVVPLAQIAPIMRKAQVAIEDKRFYQHGGVDIEGMGAVAAGVLAGKEARGASTLTQQYVKVTLQTAARRRGDTKAEKAASAVTPARKLQEMKYATEVEKVKSKDQILQDYLNLVYFGDQAYGVEAAARHFFSTTAARLTLAQAATLAGQVQNPGTVNAVVNPKGTLKRRNTVLFTMHQQGIITDKEYQDALAAPLGVKIKNQPNSCAASPYPFVCEYTVNWLKQQPALGDTPAARAGNLLNNGYRIVTTFDPRLQREAQDALNARVPADSYKPVGASSVTIDPHTGKIRAMVLSTGFSIRGGKGKQGVNWAVDYKYGANNGVAIGSTMKLFAVVAALENGYSPDSTIRDIRPAPATYYPSDYPNGCGTVEPWEVNNSEGEDNPTSTSLRTAMSHSINTAFAALVTQLGPCTVRDVATKMGLHQASNGKPIKETVSDITLGSGGSSPLNVAQTYGVVAAGGKLCPELPIESMTDSAGKKVDLKLPGCKQVIPEQVATDTASILGSVMTEGTGRGLGLADGRRSGGKTGTSDQDQSWFAGITPQLSTAVWVGNPDAFKQFHHLWINGRYYKQVFGSDLAGPIWQDVMNAASEGMPKERFGAASSTPSESSASTEQGTIPDVTGMDPDAAMQTLRDAGFDPYRSRRVRSNAVSPGTVAYTVPQAGTSAKPGRRVGLRIARGSGSSSSSNGSGNGNGNGNNGNGN